MDSRSIAPSASPTRYARCNSDLAQYSNTPSLRAAGFEDENEALRASHHTALNTTHELMPPKPKALLRT